MMKCSGLFICICRMLLIENLSLYNVHYCFHAGLVRARVEIQIELGHGRYCNRRCCMDTVVRRLLVGVAGGVHGRGW